MKLAEPGHRQGGQGDDQEKRRQHRRPQRLAAQLAQVLAAGALGEQGDDQDHRRHHEPVVDHLQQRPVGPVGAQGEDPGGDEAELGDRRVAGDQPQVGLREGHHRAVEDRGQRDHQHDLLELDRRVGEQRQHDAQEAVGADLGEHAGEDRQRRQRRGPVGVGHPAVQQEGRHLDQEGGGEEPEDPALAALREDVLLQVGDREADLARRRRRGSRSRSPRPASAASRPACRRSSSASRPRRCTPSGRSWPQMPNRK